MKSDRLTQSCIKAIIQLALIVSAWGGAKACDVSGPGGTVTFACDYVAIQWLSDSTSLGRWQNALAIWNASSGHTVQMCYVPTSTGWIVDDDISECRAQDIDALACVGTNVDLLGRRYGAWAHIPSNASQGLVTHELGHFLGMDGHLLVENEDFCTEDTWPTMSPDETHVPSGYMQSWLASLSDSDKDWIATAYNASFQNVIGTDTCPHRKCVCSSGKMAWTTKSSRWEGTVASETRTNGKTAVTCEIDCELCPAAVVGDFQLREEGFAWRVYRESGTVSYWIEGAPAIDETWTPIKITEASGPGEIQVPVESQYLQFSYYRLVEVDQNNVRSFAGMISGSKSTANPIPAEKTAIPYTEEQLRAQLALLSGSSGFESQPKRTEESDVVIYCQSGLADDLQSYVADFWAAQFGIEAHIEDITSWPSNPASFRALLKSSIEDWALEGVTRFHLIGSANDNEVRANPIEPPGRPNIIPTYFVEWDGGGGAHETAHYGTDQPYADTSTPADGIPDVIVTRWPVATTLEFLAMCLKMHIHTLGVYPGPIAVAATAYLGDYDPVGTKEDDVQLSALLLRAATETSGASFDQFQTSDLAYPNEPTAEVTDFWNEHYSDIAFVFGHISNTYSIAHVFSSGSGATMQNPFDVNELNSHSTPVVVAATCGGARYSRFQEYTPIEDFLFHPTQGASAWVGPDWYSSWQTVDDAFMQGFAMELAENKYSSMAESYTSILSTTLAGYLEAEDDGPFAALQSFAFLGDPVTPLKPTPSQNPISNFRSLGTLELAFDALGTVDVLSDIEPWEQFSFYVIGRVDFADIGEATRNSTSGLQGWEAEVDVPPSLFVLGQQVYNTPLDVGSGAHNYVVALANCADETQAAQVLVKYDALASSAVQDLEVRLRASTPSTFRGLLPSLSSPGWVACDDLELFAFDPNWASESIVVNPTGTPLDTQPPSLLVATIPAASDGAVVDIYFDEAISGSMEPSSYSVYETGSPEAPLTIAQVSADLGPNQRSLRLLPISLSVDKQYTLSVSGFSDTQGNTAQVGTIALSDSRLPVNVQITELKVDSALYGAVEGDWFEIRNLGASAADLRGWRIEGKYSLNGVISASVPLVLNAGEHLVIANNVQNLSAQAGTAIVELPRLSLAIMDKLSLFDASGLPVDEVEWNTSFVSGWNFPHHSLRSIEWSYQGDNAAGANWYQSLTEMADGEYGTPGSMNLVPTGASNPVRKELSFTAFPNPFNPRTELNVSGVGEGTVRISIFTLAGALVRSFAAIQPRDGIARFVWDGRDQSGHNVASGPYLAKADTQTGHRTLKLVLLM